MIEIIVALIAAISGVVVTAIGIVPALLRIITELDNNDNEEDEVVIFPSDNEEDEVVIFPSDNEEDEVVIFPSDYDEPSDYDKYTSGNSGF